MKKRVLLITLIVLMLSINVLAILPKTLYSPENTIRSFVNQMSSGNEEVYNYIDESNIELKNNVDKYLHNVMLECNIKKIEQIGASTYEVKTKMAAQGIGWSISGFTATFTLKEINGEFVITETDLFEHIGMENVGKFVIQIFTLVGVIILVIAIIAIVAAIISSRAKKRQKEEEQGAIRQ